MQSEEGNETQSNLMFVAEDLVHARQLTEHRNDWFLILLQQIDSAPQKV